MKSWVACVSFLSCCAAFGQQSPQNLAFEVASIKPSKPMAMGQMRIMMNADAGMLRYSGVSLKDCIRVAYRVKDFQVQGPDWIGHERFDITAKLPAGTSQEQIPEMLQALLAERFKLALHRDNKEHAIYALVPTKGGPKLKPAETPRPDAPPHAGTPGHPGPPGGKMMIMMSPDGAHLKTPSATLANLAEMLSRFSERPVVDMTGIQGEYDFDLVFAPETMSHMPPMMHGPMASQQGGGGADNPPPPADAPAEPAGTIYDAVQKYGLKMEPRKAPMEMLIVDRIERTPTDN
jgi:uncharacterized protein (TIGR03435 family)